MQLHAGDVMRRRLRWYAGAGAAAALALPGSRPAVTGAAIHSAPACAGRVPLSDSSALDAERAWARAAAARDTAALRCLLDERFMDTNWMGAVRTRDDVLHAGNAPRALVQHYGDWSVRRFDSTAIVRGVNVVTDSTGAELVRVRFTDVLRYAGGRWLAEAAQETVVRPGVTSR